MKLNLFEAEKDMSTYSVQNSDGSAYSIFKDGSGQNNDTGEKFSKVVFVPRQFAEKIRALDGMIKYFGGIQNIAIKPNQDGTFAFYLAETGKEIQGVTNGKQEPFRFPYKPQPSKNDVVFAFTADAGGRLSKYEHGGLVFEATGGKYSKENPYSDAQKTL